MVDTYPVTVLLVDDHPLVRRGLHSILEADDRFRLVGEAVDGTEALRMVTRWHPDVVLLDLTLSGADTTELCAQIVRVSAQTAILVLTAFFDACAVRACLEAGARGYLLKDVEELHLKRRLLAVVDAEACDASVQRVETGVEVDSFTGALSSQEQAVLSGVAHGLTTQEISARLHLGEDAVRAYLDGALMKMGARNRVEALLLAQKRGLL